MIDLRAFTNTYSSCLAELNEFLKQINSYKDQAVPIVHNGCFVNPACVSK